MFKKEKNSKRFVVKEEQGQGLGIKSIIVDSHTGVNYLSNYGMTPLLDSEGKVVIDKI